VNRAPFGSTELCQVLIVAKGLIDILLTILYNIICGWSYTHWEDKYLSSFSWKHFS